MGDFVAYSPEEIAWAAGVIEGDGFMSANRYTKVDSGSAYTAWRVGVKMTDEDVLERLCKIFRRGTVRGPYLNASGIKPLYNWQVAAKRDVCHVVELIRPWLGHRRGEQADKVLSALYA